MKSEPNPASATRNLACADFQPWAGSADICDHCGAHITKHEEAEMEMDLAVRSNERCNISTQRVTEAMEKSGRYALHSEPPETPIQDLITDAMHYADWHGLDFDEVLEKARYIYNGEVSDDRAGVPWPEIG